MAVKPARKRKDCGSGSSTARDFREINRREIPGLLNDNALSVYFQPIFFAKSGAIYGYEALTRIKGDERYVNTGELSRKVLGGNVIAFLDSLCQENAMREAATWEIRRKDMYLFINICVKTMMDNSYGIQATGEFVERWGLSKGKIVFEIIEKSVIHDYDLFKRIVSCYKDEGYKIAIDDFDAGYHGLKMLSRIEPDFIKIDIHRMSNTEKSKGDLNLVDRVVATCHRVGIKVIAKDIERKGESERVLGMDIELLQGYYLGEPSLFFNDEPV